MIIELIDKKGDTIGGVRIAENNKNGEVEVNEMVGDISLADITFDHLFDTNEEMVIIEVEK